MQKEGHDRHCSKHAVPTTPTHVYDAYWGSGWCSIRINSQGIVQSKNMCHFSRHGQYYVVKRRWCWGNVGWRCCDVEGATFRGRCCNCICWSCSDVGVPLLRHVHHLVTWDNFLRGCQRTQWCIFAYNMHFPQRHRQPRQTGGLQTDGAMVRSFSDHAGTRRALEWTSAAFSVQSWGATFFDKRNISWSWCDVAAQERNGVAHVIVPRGVICDPHQALLTSCSSWCSPSKASESWLWLEIKLDCRHSPLFAFFAGGCPSKLSHRKATFASPLWSCWPGKGLQGIRRQSTPDEAGRDAKMSSSHEAITPHTSTRTLTLLLKDLCAPCLFNTNTSVTIWWMAHPQIRQQVKAQQTIGAAPKPDPKSRLHLVENTTVAIPAPIQKLKKPEMDMVASKTMARIQQQPDFTKKFERPVPRTTAISFRWLWNMWKIMDDWHYIYL